MGRVMKLDETQIILTHGVLPTSKNHVHIDCAADGLNTKPACPVFAGKNITLQTVFPCQQVFSAAFIAHVELKQMYENQKNELCDVIPNPQTADQEMFWIIMKAGSSL